MWRRREEEEVVSKASLISSSLELGLLLPKTQKEREESNFFFFQRVCVKGYKEMISWRRERGGHDFQKESAPIYQEMGSLCVYY